MNEIIIAAIFGILYGGNLSWLVGEDCLIARGILIGALVFIGTALLVIKGNPETQKCFVLTAAFTYTMVSLIIYKPTKN